MVSHPTGHQVETRIGEPESPKPGSAHEKGVVAGGGGLICQKKRVSNFFDHLRPLAPMESCVDFYHTNFSRRSHPCHPEFLLLGRMSKSGPFVFELGPTLGRLWDDLGETWGRLWADPGPTLGRLWASLGPTLGLLWVDFGPTLGQNPDQKILLPETFLLQSPCIIDLGPTKASTILLSVSSIFLSSRRFSCAIPESFVPVCLSAHLRVYQLVFRDSQM